VLYFDLTSDFTRSNSTYRWNLRTGVTILTRGAANAPVEAPFSPSAMLL